LIDGFLEVHRENCTLIDCPLEKYKILNREVLKKFLENDERERFFDILKIMETSY
jgi:hypothetical protein